MDTIKVELGTGLWGTNTGECTASHIWRAIRKTQETAKRLNASIKSTENTLITVEVAKGTEIQIKKLMENIRNSVITVEKVYLEKA